MVTDSVLFLIYAVLNTAAMAFVKMLGTAVVVKRWWRVAGAGASAVVTYAAGLAVLLFLLSAHEVSTVFPIAIGFTVLATNVTDFHFFKEAIDKSNLAGTIMLIVGVALIYADG